MGFEWVGIRVADEIEEEFGMMMNLLRRLELLC